MGVVPALDPARPRPLPYRLASAFAQTGVGRWVGIHVSAHIDEHIIRATGGRLSTFLMAPVVLLTVPGRKTGTPRTTPLVYFTQGEEVIVIASSYGRDKHPAWYRNVLAHPEVSLTARGKTASYVARETTGSERQRLFALAERLYPGYADYERRAGAAGRAIPVLALKPA
jgi:deazaflavin-dependent oxidoreductase (nitroreductase family)